MSTNVINLLKPLSWRGVTAPCSVIATNFAHQQAERAYPYLDVEGHDNTRRKSKKVRVVLHFLNSIEDGLYPTKWGTWRGFLDDGSAGAFYHPDLGKINARVESGSYEITAQSASGITVTVEFTETRNDFKKDISYTTPPADAKQAASNADAAMAVLGIDYPDGTNDLSLADSIAAIESFFELTPQLVLGKINAIEGTITNLMDRFDRIGADASALGEPDKDAIANDPARWVLMATLSILFDALESLRAQVVAQARATATITTTADRTMSSIADELGGDLGDLLLLNGPLGTLPIIPRGSVVKYYSASS